MMLRLLTLALLLAANAPASAQPALPENAIGFVHVRAAEMWKHDLFKGLREIIAAAGPKALAAFEEQMSPNPADIKDATVIFVLGPRDLEESVIVVTFKNDLDAEKIRKLYLPEAATSTVGGRKFYIDSDKDVALTFPDAKHLVGGHVKAVESYLAKAAAKEGPLVAAMAAAPTKAITIAVNVKALPIPPRALDEIPPDLRPLTRVQSAVLTLDLSVADPVLELRAAYGSDAAAVDAEKAFKAAIAMGKAAMREPRAEMEKKLYANAGKGPQPIEKAMEAGAALLALGGLTTAEAQLDKLPIARSGSDMTARLAIPKEVVTMSGMYTGVMAGLLLPAVQKTRMAASSSVSANNLKQIALSFHVLHDMNNKLPGAAICSAEGKPLLSWRVAILPYIEQDNLYKQFKLDEPWDSAANKPLIEKMPKIYLDPRVPSKPGETVYKVFVGKDALLDWKTSKTFAQVSDGLSNTILAAEAGDPVIWTKPEELEFDAKKDLPKLALPGGLQEIWVAMGDGSVRRINLAKVSAKTIKLAVGAADGEVLPQDWYGEAAPLPETRRVAPAARTAAPIPDGRP